MSLNQADPYRQEVSGGALPVFRNVGSGDSHCSVLLIVNAGTMHEDSKGERKKGSEKRSGTTHVQVSCAGERSRGWKQR